MSDWQDILWPRILSGQGTLWFTFKLLIASVGLFGLFRVIRVLRGGKVLFLTDK